MPAINFSTLNNLNITIPDMDTMNQFTELSESIRRKQLVLKNENKCLVELRDALLLNLMSGELDLSEVEI